MVKPNGPMMPYQLHNLSGKPPHMMDWSLEEDTVFENMLAEFWGAPDRLEKAAGRLPARTLEQVRHRFRLLEVDVNNIEAGRIPLPNYASAQEHTSMERRKGIPWTEEEHRLFLMGLAKFGKGDWRSISRNYVISRTPTQVASHAQKYFIRLNSLNKKDKRRSSIHDITTPGTSHSGGGMSQQGQQGAPPTQMTGGFPSGLHPPRGPPSNVGPRPMMPNAHPFPPPQPLHNPGAANPRPMPPSQTLPNPTLMQQNGQKSVLPPSK